MSIPIRKFTDDFTITVTFHETNEWKIRKWIAAKLIVLAARILGCGIKFEGKDEEKHD